MSSDIIKNVSAAGTSAVITVTAIHPIDVVKTRLQLSGQQGMYDYKQLGIRGTVSKILQEEGIAAFWKGIGAAWLRESSYTSLRLGLYSPIKKMMGVTNQSNFFWKFSAGSMAGAIGSLVGNPFDVAKTRMMASENKVSPSFLSTMKDIHRVNGFSGFYKGLQANVMRACVLNGTKMACYDQIKLAIIKSNMVPSGIPTQFCAAFGAGFFMASAVAPFDMIRTQLMNQNSTSVNKGRVYKGFVDCFTTIVREKGVFGLYAGFVPIWARFAPTTCLQLVIFDQIKPLFGVEGNGE